MAGAVRGFMVGVLLAFAILSSIASEKAIPTTPGGLPSFSWETLPVYTHTCNESGPFNALAIEALARYPIVTIEKGQGVFQSPNNSNEGAEERIVSQLEAVKAANSSVWCLLYLNSILSWTFYDLDAELEAQPSLWLLNRTDLPVRSPGDPSFPQPKDGLLVFDFNNPEVFSMWVETALKGIDGAFADRAENFSVQTAGWPSTLSPEVALDLNNAHFLALQQVQNSLNARPTSGMLIGNNFLVEGVKATMIERFQSSEDMILQLAQASAAGYLVEAHAGYYEDGSDSFCTEITNSLAAFLIAAGEYSYYHCSKGWASDPLWPQPGHDNDEWLTWRPEYSRPLGVPLDPPATKEGQLYVRKFSSGTNVTWDPSTSTGSISWSDGFLQVGRPTI